MLSIVEKVIRKALNELTHKYSFQAHGVFVEWKPADAGPAAATNGSVAEDTLPDNDWVVEGVTQPVPSAPPRNYERMIFASDLEDLRSFTHNDSKKGISSAFRRGQLPL